MTGTRQHASLKLTRTYSSTRLAIAGVFPFPSPKLSHFQCFCMTSQLHNPHDDKFKHDSADYSIKYLIETMLQNSVLQTVDQGPASQNSLLIQTALKQEIFMTAFMQWGKKTFL